MQMSKPTAEQIVERVTAHQAKMQDVFGSGAGKEILEEWIESFVYDKLYHESERTTAYAIGQRDFVLMIKDIVQGK